MKAAVSPLLYSLKKICQFLTTSEAILIYKSLIRPKLEYCSTLLLGTSQENEMLLEQCQNRATRIVCRATFSKPFSVSQAKSTLGIPSLSQRRSESFSNIVGSVLDEKGSSALLSAIGGCQFRTRRLRSSCKWILPHSTTNFGRRRFVFQAIKALKNGL